MKIKLFKASFFYPDFLDLLYKRDISLKDKTYKEQYDTIMVQKFSWADFWKINLEARGNYLVEETIVNAEHLQKKWAQENGVTYNNDNWHLDILKNQIMHFKPDILFAEDSKFITPDFRRYIRKQCPTIKLIIGWDCIKMNDASRFEGTDVMMSCLDSIESYYRLSGFKTFLFQFGFETSILNYLEKRSPVYDFTFVGSLILFMGGHFNRLGLLSELHKKTNINLWLAGTNPSLFHFLAYQLGTINRGKVSDLLEQLKLYPNFRKLHKHNKGRAFGLEMYQILADSKITLNTHIDVAGNRAGNIRLWEATGVGTCLITDWKPNLNELFEIDKEIVTYKSADECVEKAKYLLENDEERKKIAEAGQKRTLDYYNLNNRLDSFTSFIENLL